MFDQLPSPFAFPSKLSIPTDATPSKPPWPFHDLPGALLTPAPSFALFQPISCPAFPVISSTHVAPLLPVMTFLHCFQGEDQNPLPALQ